MDIITNHTERAINFIVPYLREFTGVMDLASVGSDRWQYIENLVWYILANFNIDIAEGYWLDLLGERAGQTRQIFIPDTGLFTFDVSGSGFDEGLLATGVGAGGVYGSVQDEVYRLFIKFAFVRNNFNGTRASLINALKILTGAEKVLIESSEPLKMELTLYVDPPQDYLTTYETLIRQLVPQCVEVESISYVSPT